MKIYTKQGDEGYTRLIGGEKLSKDDLRIQAFGSLDETNAHIGMLAAYTINAEIRPFLKSVQDILFVIGSNLAVGNEKNRGMVPSIEEQDIEALEQKIDEMEQLLTPLTRFVLPGGHKEVAQAHIARTVSRRAERDLVAFARSVQVHPLLLKYINRLSDFLFVFSRDMARRLNAEEVYWEPRK